MAYTAITNAEIDPDSPLTTGLFFKIRDNTDFGRNTSTGTFLDAGFTTNSINADKLVNNSVGQTQVGTDAIHTDELSTTPIEVTSNPGGTGPKTVAIALDTTDELFFMLSKMIDNGAGLHSVDVDKFETAATTFNRRVVCTLDTTAFDSTPGITIRVTKVDSSPPWDIGDGEIPFFVYVDIDESGNPVSVWSASNPPWDTYALEENMVKRKLSDEELVRNFGVKESATGRGRKYRLKRSITDLRTGEFKDKLVEIDAEFKNTHMRQLANPFNDWVVKDSKNKIITKNTTTVLIDPCETNRILELAKGGFSINDMVLGTNPDVPQLKISNSFMKNRKTPHEDIKIIPLSWR